MYASIVHQSGLLVRAAENNLANGSRKFIQRVSGSSENLWERHKTKAGQMLERNRAVNHNEVPPWHRHCCCCCWERTPQLPPSTLDNGTAFGTVTLVLLQTGPAGAADASLGRKDFGQSSVLCINSTLLKFLVSVCDWRTLGYVNYLNC